MVKFLYKTLLVSILSGSLSMMSFMALAEDAVVGKDANGNLVEISTLKLEATKQNDMLSSITMIAAGAIAGRMAASYRPLTMDVGVAAAGGVAFIAGEVISNVGFKKTIDEMSIEIKKTSEAKKDQDQIQRLQDLKKSYEEAKKSTTTKKNLQLAASAAFLAAAGIATYLSFQEEAMDIACNGAITTATTGLQACISAGATGVGATEAASCTACMGEMGTYSGTFKTYKEAVKTPGPSEAKDKATAALRTSLSTGPCVIQSSTSASVSAISSGVRSVCGSAIKMKMADQTSSAPLTTGLNKILFGKKQLIANEESLQSRENNFMEQALTLLIPKAQAGWMPLLGLGASAAASYFLITKTWGTAIDVQMYSPLNRAIAFGILGGLAFLSSKASQNQINSLDENIKKIDKILNDLNGNTKGIASANITEKALVGVPLSTNSDGSVPLSPKTTITTDCATSNTSSNCTSLASQISSLSGFSDLPSSFKTIATQSATLGDNLSGKNTISGSTLSDAASLAGKQGAIGKLLAKTQTKLNSKLASDGKPKIDFEGAQNKLLKVWNAQTKSALGGTSPGSFLSSVGGSPLSGSSDLGKVTATESAKKTTGFSSGVAGAPSGSKDKDLTLDFKEAGAATEAKAGGAGADQTKYDIGANDITTNQGASIFEVISNRYIKSAYPKLLEEIPVKK